MKILKKVSCVLTAAVCAASLAVGGATVSGATDIDEDVKEQVISYAQSLTETITALSDEEIADYSDSTDDFTVSTMTAWTDAKAEVGELVEIQEDTEVSYSDSQYTATVNVDFEDLDAEFVYTLDETLTPTAVAINVQYPLSTLLKNAALNTVMGLGTVFVVLVILIFVISLFKYIPGSSAGKKKKEEPAPAAPAPAAAPAAAMTPAAASEAAPETDNGELIAVIAAAVAAAEGTATTDGFVVRSIRKIKRPGR